MKYIKNGIFASLFMICTTALANEAIFESAKDHLDLDSRYIQIEYNTNIVEDFCPKQSVGCYTSADRGRIIVRDDLSKTHLSYANDLRSHDKTPPYPACENQSRYINLQMTCPAKCCARNALLMKALHNLP